MGWIKKMISWFIKKKEPVNSVTLDDIINELSKPAVKKEKTQLEIIIHYINFLKMLELEEYYLENDPPIFFRTNNDCYVLIRPETVFRCNYKN